MLYIPFISYSKVYFIERNYGYDDAEGGYIHVSHDHVAYRY